MKRNCCCCHCYFCYCCRCCWRRRLSWGWICAWGMLLRSIEELFVVDGNWRTREMRSFFIVCGTQNANQQKAYDSTTHAFSVWRGFDKVIQLYSGYYYSGNRNRRNEMANARLGWMDGWRWKVLLDNACVCGLKTRNGCQGSQSQLSSTVGLCYFNPFGSSCDCLTGNHREGKNTHTQLPRR